MLVVEGHPLLEEVQLGFVCLAVGVVGFGTHLLTLGMLLKLKLTHSWQGISQATVRPLRRTCNG